MSASGQHGKSSNREAARRGPRRAAGMCGAVAAVAAVLSLAVPSGAGAQEPPLESDRPGLTFAPSTVGAVHLQLEMGAPEIAYRSFGAGEDWTFTFPILARLGIADGFELRAGLSPLTAELREADPGFADRAEVGPDDLELGMKWLISEGREATPTFLLVPSVTLPTGEAGIGRDRASFQGAFQASWDWIGDLGANLLMGVGLESRREDDWTGTGILAADVRFPLGGELDAYGEVGWLPSAAGPDDVLGGGGATWKLTPYVQIDAFFDVGLTSRSTDWIVGAGFARRF